MTRDQSQVLELDLAWLGETKYFCRIGDRNGSGSNYHFISSLVLRKVGEFDLDVLKRNGGDNLKTSMINPPSIQVLYAITGIFHLTPRCILFIPIKEARTSVIFCTSLLYKRVS